MRCRPPCLSRFVICPDICSPSCQRNYTGVASRAKYLAAPFIPSRSEVFLRRRVLAAASLGKRFAGCPIQRALFAVQFPSQVAGAPRCRCHPRPVNPRRVVSNMLIMAASQFRHPVQIFILVVATDRLFHVGYRVPRRYSNGLAGTCARFRPEAELKCSRLTSRFHSVGRDTILAFNALFRCPHN